MNTLVKTFNDMPRSGRWAVVAAVCLVGYFAVVEPLVGLTVKTQDRADAKARMLADWERTAAKQKEASSVVAAGLRDYGEVKLPDDPKARGEALNARIAKVLKTHGVNDYARKERAGPLPAKRATALQAAVEGSGRVTKLVRDVDFQCTAETLAAIVADLERSPEISSVSAVHIRKAQQSGSRASSARTLLVTITTEAWVLQRAEAAS